MPSRGLGNTGSDATGLQSQRPAWLQQPQWSLYLARIDGKPAAAATLFIHDRVGHLADAATAPSFRGRGLQQALLDLASPMRTCKVPT